jgi:chemotaxis protein histidine kinase CheA
MSESSADVKIIPPNIDLRRKITGSDRPGQLKIDESRLAAAQTAIDGLEENFLSALAEELVTLADLIGKAEADETTRAAMLSKGARLAHDIKGQGGTFGYPLLTEIGQSLYNLLRDTANPTPVHFNLMRLHVEALHVIESGRLKGQGGRSAREVKERLAQAVSKRA